MAQKYRNWLRNIEIWQQKNIKLGRETPCPPPKKNSANFVKD